MLTHTYHDAYLSPRVTAEHEARATADVATLGDLPTAWVDRLVVLRVYILVCVDSQGETDDLFAAKLTTYRREFDVTLSQARAAAAESAGTGPALFSAPILRG